MHTRHVRQSEVVKSQQSTVRRDWNDKITVKNYQWNWGTSSNKRLLTLGVSNLQCHYKTIESELSREMSKFVRGMVENLPALEERLRAIREQQETRPWLPKVEAVLFWTNDWVERPVKVISQTSKTSSLAALPINWFIVRGARMVIPTNMRAEILEKIHSGHEGMTKCR